ncbi:uncharacterized protein [Triticum aestivum]|uniref:uncharacterized protein n=1 Tax=Triticum aestivum TaxID=4565 RepID=UPI001D0310F9|nr:uncharacterized protein LOC123130763 [Triticum aestivum]
MQLQGETRSREALEPPPSSPVVFAARGEPSEQRLFTSSPSPAEHAPSSFDLTTASTTRSHLRPSPHFRRRLAGEPPPPTLEATAIFPLFRLSGVRRELLSGV